MQRPVIQQIQGELQEHGRYMVFCPQKIIGHQ